MQKFEIDIVGEEECGYMTHRFPLTPPETEAGSHIPTPEKESEAATYRNEAGAACGPASHILGAMIKSGGSFKRPGRKTYKDLMKGGIRITPALIPILNPTDSEPIEPTIDIRAVTVGKAHIHRARPFWPHWMMRFVLTIVNDNEISPEICKKVLAYAGENVGIGEIRPMLGRFKVTRFEEVAEAAKIVA